MIKLNKLGYCTSSPITTVHHAGIAYKFAAVAKGLYGSRAGGRIFKTLRKLDAAVST